MQTYNEELMRIKKILKDNPKGLTVSEISNKININRTFIKKMEGRGFTRRKIKGYHYWLGINLKQQHLNP